VVVAAIQRRRQQERCRANSDRRRRHHHQLPLFVQQQPSSCDNSNDERIHAPTWKSLIYSNIPCGEFKSNDEFDLEHGSLHIATQQLTCENVVNIRSDDTNSISWLFASSCVASIHRVFDIENKSMWWANEAALVVWNAPSLDALLLRSFSDDMSQATTLRLHDYLRRFREHNEKNCRIGMLCLPFVHENTKMYIHLSLSLSPRESTL
jgi:hypothetical protein